MPASETFESVATPEPFVTALPTGLPFSVKLMVWPLMPFTPSVSVAERLTVPP